MEIPPNVQIHEFRHDGEGFNIQLRLSSYRISPVMDYMLLRRVLQAGEVCRIRILDQLDRLERLGMVPDA